VRPVRTAAKAGPSKRADSPIVLDTDDDIEEDETPVKSKGKGKAPAKKLTGQTPVQKQRDVLARRLNALHSRMYQIRANLKALEVEQDEVLAEVSDVVGELEELDI
jgi:septal ring factor EnvC (AmiA/AmiB activator)